MTRLAPLQRGNGQPFVLLHGFLQTEQTFARLLPYLGGAPVYAWRLPGHHHEHRAGQYVDFASVVAQLARDVAALGPVRAVGYSLGGRLLLGLLADHPRAVATATLIGVNPGLAMPHEREARALIEGTWAESLTHDFNAFLETWNRMPVFESQQSVPPALRAQQDASRRNHDAREIARSLTCIGLSCMPDYRNRIASVRASTQLLVGARDTKFVELARELAALNEKLSVTLIPDVGHNCLLEAPGLTGRSVQSHHQLADRTGQ